MGRYLGLTPGIDKHSYTPGGAMIAPSVPRRACATLILVGLLRASVAPAGIQAGADRGRPEADAAGPRYAGWAMIAYPSLTEDDLRAMLWRQLSAGANVV